eukprot:6200709-Pleurochrysis_carterae.AAC.1
MRPSCTLKQVDEERAEVEQEQVSAPTQHSSGLGKRREGGMHEAVFNGPASTVGVHSHGRCNFDTHCRRAPKCWRQ